MTVDTRPLGDYQAEHMAGARHVAAADLEADPSGSLSDVDPGGLVLLYGAGGPDGPLARAAAALQAAGFTQVRVYRLGFADWVASGGATE